MSANEKTLIIAVLAASVFGLWYWYRTQQLTADYNAAAQAGNSPS